MIFNSRVSIFFLICSSTIFLLGCKQKESLSDFTQVNNRVEIKNSKVRAVFKKENGLISQIFYAKKNSQWQEVAAAFLPPTKFPSEAVKLFDQDLVAYRYLSNSMLSDFSLVVSEKQKTVVFSGSKVPNENLNPEQRKKRAEKLGFLQTLNRKLFPPSQGGSPGNFPPGHPGNGSHPVALGAETQQIGSSLRLDKKHVRHRFGHPHRPKGAPLSIHIYMYVLLLYSSVCLDVVRHAQGLS